MAEPVLLVSAGAKPPDAGAALCRAQSRAGGHGPQCVGLFVAAIRGTTLRGRPVGSDSFISKLEALLGRRLRVGSVGRPKKKMNEEK